MSLIVVVIPAEPVGEGWNLGKCLKGKVMRSLFTFLLLFTGMNVIAGYNLHIERNTKITESEWLAVCEQDKSLTIKNFAFQTNPETGESIKISTPSSCVWRSPVLRREYIFFFSHGRIALGTQNAQIKKAKSLARQLNAKVVGDEGEEY